MDWQRTNSSGEGALLLQVPSSAQQQESHVLPALPPHVTCKGQGNLTEVQKGEQDTWERSIMATLLHHSHAWMHLLHLEGQDGSVSAGCLGRL